MGKAIVKSAGILLLGLAISLISVGLAGAEKKPFAGKTLKVTTWSSEWIEAFEPIGKQFEKKTGAKVEFIPMWSGFVAKLQAAPADDPPFDLFQHESMTYEIARKKRLTLPLRAENIPNLKKVFPAVKRFKPMVEGYGVVIGGQPIAPLYNPDVMKKLGVKPTKWADFMRPEMKCKTAFEKDYWVFDLYTAAYILDVQPGALEIYTDLNLVYDKMAELAARSKIAFSGGAQIKSLVDAGEVAVAQFYGGTVAEAELAGMNLKGYLPEEGYIGYLDIMSIARGTKNREVAEAFINELLSNEAQTRMADIGGSGPVIDIIKNLAKYVQESVLYIKSNKEWETFGVADYEYFMKAWDILHERFEKKVLSKIGKECR